MHLLTLARCDAITPCKAPSNYRHVFHSQEGKNENASRGAVDACILAAVIVQYSGDELLLQLNVIKVSQRGEKKVLDVLEHIVKVIAIGL